MVRRDVPTAPNTEWPEAVAASRGPLADPRFGLPRARCAATAVLSIVARRYNVLP